MCVCVCVCVRYRVALIVSRVRKKKRELYKRFQTGGLKGQELLERYLLIISKSFV